MNNISSIIYGSSARLDNDIYSDKDILIASNYIDDNVEKEAKNLAATGWNCSLYTYSQLESLAKSGSLFIQHLKQDGKNIIDHCGILAKIFEHFSAKKSYSNDIVSAKNFFETIALVEHSSLGILWAIDVIIVGLRNYSILLSAENDIYEFSYKNLITNSKHIANLTTNEKNILLSLRKYKYIFRNDIMHKECESDLLFNTLEILNNKYKLDIQTTLTGKESFFHKQLHHINSKQLSGYQKLRMSESLFLSAKKFIHQRDQTYFYNIIKKPRQCYCFNDVDFINKLISTLNEKYNVPCQ